MIIFTKSLKLSVVLLLSGENRVLIKSFQVNLFRQKDSGNQRITYCENDGEYTVFCDICDKLCFERYYKNHLKSETHTYIFHKGQN